MHEIWRIIRFGFSGVISTFIHSAVVIFLVEYTHMDPVVASFPAFLTANANSYLLNRFWVFKSAKGSPTQIVIFFVVSLVSLLINTFGMYIGTRWMGAYYMIVLGVSVVFAAAVTYVLHRLLTFRPREK